MLLKEYLRFPWQANHLQKCIFMDMNNQIEMSVQYVITVKLLWCHTCIVVCLWLQVLAFCQVPCLVRWWLSTCSTWCLKTWSVYLMLWLMAKYIRLAHKQSHFHKHIIIRQIKHTGDLCAPLPKHKSTSSKSFKAPSGCVPWQLVLLLNQHMCFYWNYIGHFRYTVRPQKTIIRPQKTIVSPVQNAI